MKTTFQDRLKECLQAATGGQQAPLARFIAERHGIALQSARSRVSNWVTNERSPSPLSEMIGTITDFFAQRGVVVRAEWLASGSEPQSPQDPVGDAVKIHGAHRTAAILDAATVRQAATALPDRARLAELIGEFTKKNKGIPVYSDSSKSSFAFEVAGDAMAPTLRAGDVVVVDCEAELASGKVVLIEHRETILLRRLQHEGGAGWLVADNSRYAALPEAEVRLIGRVIEMVRRDL